MKTSELTEAALDWAVAKCEGKLDLLRVDWVKDLVFKDLGPFCAEEPNTLYSPSQVWSQGGPILERERIELHEGEGTSWTAMQGGRWGATEFGPTMLVAGMRCYVASRLGDEVEIPEELSNA